ncbi:MAG: diguanylate cyclase [Pseudomonadota bacterium]
MTRKILIVDDEAPNLGAIARCFEENPDLDYDVLQSTSASRALKIAALERPDLIITDWDMPEINGIELIRRLKADPDMAQIPVIMCTGVMTTAENLRTALGAGAVDFIRKPVDAIELQARTHSMLELASSLQTVRERNEELRENYERMARMARTDMLTQLSNRFDIVDQLNSEIRAAEPGRSLVVALADIDHFKSFNDRHGHSCGDFVLQQLAALLQGLVQHPHSVGRWGGEELIMLFREVDLDAAAALAEQVRAAIADASWEFEEQELRTTMTFGVCQLEGGDDVDRLLQRADAALYEGKRRGRNAVVASR